MSWVRNSPTTAQLAVTASVIPLLFVWQGLDFTDMGYWLTGYQQFYSAPDGLLNWLSSFIGHWVGLLLGGVVLSYKLGYVLVITMSAALAYHLLASLFGRSQTLAALVLLTVLFVGKSPDNWIGYNNLTALFYLAGAGLLFFGLVRNRKVLVIAAGGVLGISLFVRFPNLLGFLLLLAVWFHAWMNRWTFKEALIWSSWFLFGFALGFVLILGLIVLHGHEVLYFQGVHEIFRIAADVNSHHSGQGLLNLFMNDHIHAFKWALFLIVIGGPIAIWLGKQRTLPALIIIIGLALLMAFVFYSQDRWKWAVTGLCYVVLMAIVFFESKKNSPMALMAFLAGMVLFLAPLGSGNGIRNAVYGMWLVLPLMLMWLWKNSGLSIFSYSIDAAAGRIFCKIIVLALLIQSIFTACLYTYRDSENRFSLTHTINAPLLVGTFTTAERAKVVTELLDAMSHFVKPGDWLLAYNEIPTIHFLTKTRPWLGNPWPMLLGPEKIAALLKEKESLGTPLPIIVRATVNSSNPSWPTNARVLDTSDREDESRRVFAEFERRHEYSVVWSNDAFEILTTKQ